MLDEQHGYPTWYTANIELAIAHTFEFVEHVNPATLYKRYHMKIAVCRNIERGNERTIGVMTHDALQEIGPALQTCGWTPVEPMATFSKPVECRHTCGRVQTLSVYWMQELRKRKDVLLAPGFTPNTHDTRMWIKRFQGGKMYCEDCDAWQNIPGVMAWWYTDIEETLCQAVNRTLAEQFADQDFG